MILEEKAGYHPGGIQLLSLPEPRNVREAMAVLDADGWRDAMDQNMRNLESNNVYELVPISPGVAHSMGSSPDRN